ncbi:Glycoside hydrolase, family 28 [Corchorus capsularis]|uniref:Glycoside hydrolase, family 28 n=1 Tax=Corchorus capsularis TaxID=210143 RepID=A0A1R3IEW4_COCAP|nr:Glycoside hydrolase, family 28 [Corchorus capsularis]
MAINAMDNSKFCSFINILVFCFLCSNIVCNAAIGLTLKPEAYDVLDFGAAQNGSADSSEAFLEAWDYVCSKETEKVSLIVPENETFLLHPVTFNGPCKAKEIEFQIQGKLISPISPKTWEGHDKGKWITFSKVSGLKIKGNGEINGRGWGWWNQSCRDHRGLAMIFQSCKNSSLSEVRMVNSAQTHVLITGSDDIIVEGLMISAPETSPNTDGIHLSSARNIVIRNSVIGSGDDCVSIGDQTSNVDISRVKCGPGHGISIGSLGRAGNYVQVQNIRVSKVVFNGTTNGARIKTWQVGKGFVRGVTFENLIFHSVKNPIIIDQNYCDVRGACKELQTGVRISDVAYRNLWGTSSTAVAITLNCSRSVSCTGLLLHSVWLKSAMSGKNVTSTCTNAHGATVGVVHPAPCLQHHL